MSLLQDYVSLKNEVEDRMEGAKAWKRIVLFQELSYRVFVLETLQAFMNTVPDIEDGKAVNYHVKAMIAYLQDLPDEHKFALKADEEGKEARETALKALQKACKDACRKLDEYEPEEQEEYIKGIKKILGSVVKVWAQYRETLVAVYQTEKAEKKPTKKPEKESAESEEMAMVKKAMEVPCPLRGFEGMTLGQAMRKKPDTIAYLAKKYTGKNEEVKAAAIILCEYAKKQAA